MTSLRFLRLPLFLLLILLAAPVLAGWSGPIGLQAANAAPPTDSRSLAPNHRSELPGAGYLLTDPYQGASRAYWAGAYRTIAGQRAYCIDDYYDYPDVRYGYRTAEVSGWAGRRGSNSGATGHTARRISWIVNSYGTSSAPATDAAVSMAINLLIGSPPFTRSYYGYFRTQLAHIDRHIVEQIDTMIRDSDRYAGPYRTELRFGRPPAIGAAGSFTVLVRSARGYAVPWTTVNLQAPSGLGVRGEGARTTGRGGVLTVAYTALRAGPIGISARAMTPNTTMRLGFSPSHAGNNFRTGSQRVAVVSGHRLTPTRTVTKRVRVAPVVLHTRVDRPRVPRPVGTPVSDQVTGGGLVPGQRYRLDVRLQDESGLICGTTASVVTSDRRGRLSVRTQPLPVCGGGHDTFSEQLSRAGRVLARSAPDQPSETFPVATTVQTAVAAGTEGRPAGTPVRDKVRASGLLPGGSYRLRVDLLTTGDRACETATVPVAADAHGYVQMVTAPLVSCGSGRNTFTVRLADQTGRLVAQSPAWLAEETFDLVPPPTQPSSASPSAAPSHSSARPIPVPTHSSRPRPFPTVSGVRLSARPISPRPVPGLAYTGSASRVALAAGLSAIGLGGLLLMAGHRSQTGRYRPVREKRTLSP